MTSDEHNVCMLMDATNRLDILHSLLPLCGSSCNLLCDLMSSYETIRGVPFLYILVGQLSSMLYMLPTAERYGVPFEGYFE